MFLNHVKSFFNLFSLRTRLTLYYSVTALILMAIITVFLYWKTIQVLYKADYEFLADEVETIQYILESNNYNSAALSKEVFNVPNESQDSIYHYYIRLYDENNQVIIETPGFKNILAPAMDKKLNILDKKRYAWLTMDDVNYLLVQSAVKLKNNKIGSVQILLNISYQHTYVSDSNKFIFTLIIGTICAFIFGFLIANRGIKGLYELVDVVKKTTISSLNKRIDIKKLPKELSELGVAFNQMLDRIEQSHARLKQFSSDLAHELRIPIQNLMGETEIALSNVMAIKDPQLLLESNLEEFQRISSIIENILFLSRAENPQFELKKQLIHLHDEIKIVCEYYGLLAEQKHISIKCKGDGVLNANPIMFKRMIGNLLLNAITYTEDRGHINVSVYNNAENVQIILCDTGIGIAPENIPKIFDRFYRVDQSRSNHTNHTNHSGLGLAIVKSIVEMHNGSIHIDSYLGRGTTIILTFKHV